MNRADEHLLGKQILLRLNHLVELIASAYLAGGKERLSLINESRTEIQDLKWLLAQLLGNHEEYLKTALKELLFQRLPDKDMLEAVGGLEFLLENDEEKNNDLDSQKYNNVLVLDSVEQGLYYLFSQTKIYKNYKYKGFFLDYYLPAEKLAIVDIGKKRPGNSFLEYLCCQEGIILVYLNKLQIHSSRDAIRIIKKQIIEWRREVKNEIKGC